MPPDDFDKFVGSLHNEKESYKEFWSRQKDEYVAAVDGVYTEIEGFLSPWTQSGNITIEYHPLEINEEDTGIYNTRKSIIMIGSRAVSLTPIGTQLIGTKGRIDLSGALGRGRLILVDSEFTGPHVTVTIERKNRFQQRAKPEAEREINWVWKIATNPPQMKFIEFNRDNFLKTIMEITNG